MINGYKIIEERGTDELEESVIKEIKEGWQPLGGVAISLSESDEYSYYVCCQAMIKKGSLE